MEPREAFAIFQQHEKQPLMPWLLQGTISVDNLGLTALPIALGVVLTMMGLI